MPINLNTKNFAFDEKTNMLIYLEKDDDGNEAKVELTKDFFPVKLLRDVDTEEVSMQLEVNFRGKVHIEELTLDELQPSKLAEYTKFGFPFGDSYVRRLLSQWLTETINVLPIVESTKGLGWKMCDKTEYFQLQKSISTDNAINVIYDGDLLVGKHGTRAKYWKFLNQCVMPYTQTQAIVAFSASAALAKYLDNDLSLVLHLCGNSTTGKTTMLQLAASVWGSAERSGNGILQSWNATNNAIINTLCGYNGITLCFDELGASEADAKAYLNLIYVLSMGIDKKRMGYNNQAQKFSVNIMSSGELPMKVVDEVNGIDVRLLEVDYPWTENKEHSEQIKSELKQCYGYLGEAFVKILLKSPKEKLQQSLKKLTDKIVEYYKNEIETMKNKNTRIFSRAIQKIAVVSFTAFLMNKYMKLEFDYKKITKFLIEKSGLMKFPRSAHILFLEAYINSLAEDRRYCKDDKIRGYTTSPLDFEKDGYIIMRRVVFERVMIRYGYSIEEIHAHLKRLNQDGFLHTESGKNTVYNRRSFNGERCQCVEVIIDKLAAEGLDKYSYWHSKGSDNLEECDR